jgi:hypothetical protein
MRDRVLDICGPVAVRFTYDPTDPYALSMRMFEPWNRHHTQAPEWVVSREMLAVAVLWGVETPGLDVLVSTVTVTRATPGQAVRDVPVVRIMLREVEAHSNHHIFTGNDVYLDVDRRDLVSWFTTVTQVVRIGQEHRYIDIDGTIAQILGRAHKEGL